MKFTLAQELVKKAQRDVRRISSQKGHAKIA